MPHASVTPSEKPDRRRIDRSPLAMACACAHRPSREIARMPAAAVHGSRRHAQSGTASLVVTPAEFCGSRVHLAFSRDRGAGPSKARAVAEAKGNESGNHGALTSLSGGPCDRGNLCRRRPPKGQGRRVGRVERGGGDIGASGLACGPHRVHEQEQPDLRRSRGMRRITRHSCVGADAKIGRSDAKCVAMRRPYLGASSEAQPNQQA
jgi:hypothetical protein